MSGATARGEVEGRLMRIIEEVVRAGNVVLHIDNAQNLVGVTASSGGEGLDASEVLSEFLEKRAFQIIATTNPADYRKSVEQSALGPCTAKSGDRRDEPGRRDPSLGIKSAVH